MNNKRPVSLPLSDEVYLLQKYRWLILANCSNIRYHSDPRMDSHFRVLMNTYDYEDALFRIDPNLKEYRDQKEKYVQFNSRNAGNPLQAKTELTELIREFKESQFEIFRVFSSLLEKFEDPIINSFIMIEKVGNGKLYNSRLSNGPIESINRYVIIRRKPYTSQSRLTTLRFAMSAYCRAPAARTSVHVKSALPMHRGYITDSHSKSVTFCKKALRSLRCGKCFANLGRLRYRLSDIWFSSSIFLQITIAPALYCYAIATNASFYLAKY